MPPTDIPLNPMVLTPDGAVVTRSYELIEELGRGAAGVVWRARATATGREYAVKILHDDGRGAPKAIARFLQERGILLRLRHENLVAVHDLLTTADGRLALVLDLVTGGTLRELLRERGTLPPATAAELLAQVADGLAVAHATGVVHRDLKPDNILLAPTLAGGLRIKLTDFGIARLLDGSGLTTSGAVLGTPNYMAPEVIEGTPATPAADVYALGIVLYELLAGRPPFDDDGCDTAILLRHTRAAARPLSGMPPRVWALIEACLHRDPVKRPAAETLRTTLRRLATETAGIAPIPPVPKGEAGRPTFLLADPAEKVKEAPAKTPAPRPRPPRARRVTPALVAVVVVLLAAGGFVGVKLTAQRGPGPKPPPAPDHQAGAPPIRHGEAGVGVTPSAGPAAPAGSPSGSPAALPASSGAASNRPTRPGVPIGAAEEYGQWACTEERWPIGHPMVGQVCHALGTAIKFKGIFSGLPEVKADVQVTVENVETGTTVAGPVRCSNLRFTDETQSYTCGPLTANLPAGRYRVVGKWVYTDVDNLTPPGSVYGNPFDW